MWKELNPTIKIILVIWIVFLHLFFAGLIYLYFDVTGGRGLGSYSETPTPLQMTAWAEADERARAEALAPIAPNRPAGLYGSLRTDPQLQLEVVLSWDAPVGPQVDTYKIVRVDSLGTESVIADSIPAEFLEYTDSHLPLFGAMYTYTVIAVNAHGESAPSSAEMTLNGVPNAPTILQATLEQGNEAHLEWTAPSSSYVTHYRVERNVGNTTWVTIEPSIPAENLNTTDRYPLQSGKTYTYRVIALNEWSESAPSELYELRVP